MHEYLNRRQFMGAGAAVAAGVVLAGCGSTARPAGSSRGKPVRGGNVVFPTTFDLQTLDPAFSVTYSERFAYYALYDSLVAYDADFNIVPNLATHWTTSKSGTEIEMHIAPNVKFHDGTPCDAAAVKWNLDRILDPATNSPQRSQLAPQLQSVSVSDSTTIVLHLTRPWRPLIPALGERPGFIVSPTAVKKYGSEYGSWFVGSGPFRMASYTPGNQLTMARNPNYWKSGRPYLDQVQIVDAPDAATQVTRLRANNAQILANVAAKLAEGLKGASDIKVVSKPAGNWWLSSVTVKKPPFNNPNLRKAMAYATNREAVSKVVFLGQARVATSPIGLGWAYDSSLKWPYPYDVKKAQEYVKKAGAEGLSIAFTNSSATQNQAVAQVLQPGYSKMGIKLDFKTVPAEEAYPDEKAGKIIWSAGEWTPRADPDGLLRIVFYSTGFQNTSGYSNPTVDSLLDQAAELYDKTKAKPLYAKALNLINQDAVSVSLVWPNNIWAYRSNLQNVTVYPDGFVRFQDLWLNQSS